MMGHHHPVAHRKPGYLSSNLSYLSRHLMSQNYPSSCFLAPDLAHISATEATGIDFDQEFSWLNLGHL
jgi:hypothetical protein